MWKEQSPPERLSSAEALQSIPRSVAMYGIGQVGTLLVSKLTTIEGVGVLGKGKEEEQRLRVSQDFPGIIFSASTEEIISQRPEVLILTLPTFTAKDALQETAEVIAEAGVEPPILVLPQNGVNVVALAIKAFKGIPIDIVRASLLTAVMWNPEGEGIVYRGDKPKIALAQVRGRGVDGTAGLFRMAGFRVEVCPDHVSMEWSKLVLNTLGTTATITGLTPQETFQDRDLFTLEFLGLRDRARIVKAGGIALLDFEKLGMPAEKLGRVVTQVPEHWLTESPEWLHSWLRRIVARFIAGQRRNIPPSSWRRIRAGGPTEIVDYHQPFVELGQQHGLASPVDEAILQIVQAHEEGKFDLRDLTTWERRAMLLEEIANLSHRQKYLS
jgi:ketopantoate reductase